MGQANGEAGEPMTLRAAPPRRIGKSSAASPGETLQSTMDDQDRPKTDSDASGAVAIKPKRTPPSRKGMAPANAWPKGVSGNPRGRPRAGTAFSERGRERLDPDKVLDLAEKVLADESISARERLAIVLPVIDRIYVRPPQGHDVNVHATTGVSADDVALLTDAELEAELARGDEVLAAARARALTSGTEVDAPADDQVVKASAP